MNPSHHGPSKLTGASLQAARLDGCTCDPDVKTTEDMSGVMHIQILHDDWCALLQARAAQWN